MDSFNRRRILAAAIFFAASSFAQSFHRQARMIGGGGAPDRGKCTVEVVVDDVAQVEIRGSEATLRTLSGQPAQWRRFECNAPLPPDPAEFRFAGVDGRGRQTLLRDPRGNRGEAVIQIEDRDGGAEGYTFDIFWGYRGGGAPGYGGAPPPPPPPPQQPDYRDRERERERDGDRRPFGREQATSLCQQTVLNQASRRFDRAEIHVRQIALDDGPGRRDWIVGTLEVTRRYREVKFHFSCSVDFESGRVRSAQIDDRPLPDDRRR